MGGFIVGFDSDEPNIFERQIRFIQEAGVVTAMVGLLTALPGTRLFARLSREGRIVEGATGNNMDGCAELHPPNSTANNSSRVTARWSRTSTPRRSITTAS